METLVNVCETTTVSQLKYIKLKDDCYIAKMETTYLRRYKTEEFKHQPNSYRTESVLFLNEENLKKFISGDPTYTRSKRLYLLDTTDVYENFSNLENFHDYLTMEDEYELGTYQSRMFDILAEQEDNIDLDMIFFDEADLGNWDSKFRLRSLSGLSIREVNEKINSTKLGI